MTIFNIKLFIMIDIKEYTINSISELLNILENKVVTNDYTLFRGHNDFTWKLLPKIARDVIKFRSKVDNESLMIETFKRYAKQFLGKALQNEWDYFALAQHHGMATRLLDWTTNPLAALWFCVQKPCCVDFGALWVLQLESDDYLKASQIEDDKKTKPWFEVHDPLKLFNYYSPLTITNSIIVYQPHLLDQRIVNQNGWFTVHQNIKNEYVDLSQHEKFSSRLTKILVPKSVFSDIRSKLDTLGVNQMSLFPDLDGVSKYAEWFHTVMEDEPDDSE